MEKNFRFPVNQNIDEKYPSLHDDHHQPLQLFTKQQEVAIVNTNSDRVELFGMSHGNSADHHILVFSVLPDMPLLDDNDAAAHLRIGIGIRNNSFRYLTDDARIKLRKIIELALLSAKHSSN